MKIKYTILVISIIAMLLINGCSGNGTEENVVKDIDDATENSAIEITETHGGSETNEDDTEESDEEETTDEETDDEEEEESDDTEETTATEDVTELLIADMTVTPKNVNIELGDTIRWTSKQKNFKHIIVVKSTGLDTEMVGGPFILLNGDSAEFTFNMTGTFEYFSKPAYNYVTGEIVVS